MGIGICIGVILISLAVAKVHGSFKMGQAVFFIFIGLLAASVWPAMPQATHNFVTQIGTSVQHTNVNK